MKACIIVGTRPEIIKMSPVIRACELKGAEYFVLHTGQHYSYELDRKMFEDLELKEPRYNLDVGSKPFAKQIGFMAAKIKEILKKEKPDIVFVQGDTNSVLAGNTIVDAVRQNLEIANKKVDILKKLGLKKGEYVAVTAHRAENVDVKERLQGILEGLKLVGEELGIPIIYPIHPRTEKMINEFRIEKPGNIRFLKPMGFLEFLQLESNAKLIITDSGGLQEEACILKIPCVTVRDSTERPETVKLGMNVLAGADQDKIAESARLMLKKKIVWKNPFGDGKSGERIVEISLKHLG